MTDPLLVALMEAFIQLIKDDLARMERKVKQETNGDCEFVQISIGGISLLYIFCGATHYLMCIPNSMKKIFPFRGLARSSVLRLFVPPSHR